MYNLNSRFPAQAFNASDVDNVLVAPQEQIHVLLQSEKNQEVYKRFYEDFGLFLKKLPSGKVNKYVSDIYNKKLIYVGFTKNNKAKEISSRVLLNPDNKKLTAIVLNSDNLDIDLKTGETFNIDDCIYAAYLGLIRAAIILNTDIKSNKELHQLLTTYMYLIFIKVIGKNTFVTQRQKDFLRLSCVYIYYIYFFNEKHSYAVSILKREYKDIVEKDIFEDFIKQIELNKGYTTIKDIPKLLIDLKIIFVDPKQIYMSMIRSLKPIGFYTFIGPLDYFISSLILTKYPSELFSKYNLTNPKLHDSIEELTEKYIKKIKFEVNGLPKKA